MYRQSAGKFWIVAAFTLYTGRHLGHWLVHIYPCTIFDCNILISTASPPLPPPPMGEEEQYLPEELPPAMAEYGMNPGRMSRGFSQHSYDGQLSHSPEVIEWMPKEYLEKGTTLHILNT